VEQIERRARPGRPRRVDVDAIVDATLAIGLEHATVQNVAARVGVSSQALYQYVAGRDELLRLAGQRAFARMDEVVDDGQHWAAYLRESAEAVRRVIIDNPQLVALNLAGLISDQEVLLRSGAAMEALRRRGFDPEGAVAASAAVLAVALASAIDDIREAQFEAAGEPWPSRVFRAVAGQQDEYPTMITLAQSGYRPGSDERFDERLRLVLLGIAAQYDLEIDHTVRAAGVRQP
jgi:AcrR family transcriptional regulator